MKAIFYGHSGRRIESVWSFLTAVTAVAAAAGLLAIDVLAQAPPAAQAQQRLDGGFRLFDANRDGTLDRPEFAKLTEAFPRLKANPDGADYVFNLLDKDGDAKLTLEEFRGLALLQLAAQQTAADNPPPSPQPARNRPAAKPSPPDQPPTADELAFFERKIRPVLADSCYSCHSAEAEKIKGGLVLDTREGLRRGGDNGHGVVPGDLDSSLLIKAIRYHDSDLQMPPKKEGGKLPDEVISHFEAWVRMGAPDPRDGKGKSVATINLEKGREHWSFQPPRKSTPPLTKDANWPRTDLDKFILAELEANGLKPVGEADPRTLIRRLYFDLIGLPPTPEEVESFVKECEAAGDSTVRISPPAVEKVVERLLASPQFGEKWGRHWLDVARYAESSGKENNVVYPHAWRYRDWVIQAFNEDKPYDRFLKEQLAGDQLPAPNSTQEAEQLIATAFLALGPKSHNTRNLRQFQLDLVDEQIDVVSQALLGLTVACARCHDHKFDPVSQQDYYAMAGIFASTETRFGTPRFVQNNNASPLFTLPEDAELADAPPLPAPQVAALRRQLEAVKQEREQILAEARAANDRAAFANPRLLRINTQLAVLEKLAGRYDDHGQPRRLTMGVQDRVAPRDAPLLQRGELERPGDIVPRGFVQVLAGDLPPKITGGSGRLELAEWIASPNNPLTARVMVNRVWLHLFGEGLVPTPDNFGASGQPPTHPALLDYLAVSFVENGWSVKQLVRALVSSRTYQLSSDYDPQNYAADPDNTRRWRMSQRRLTAEQIRDAMWAVAGQLELTPPRGSPVSYFEGAALQMLRPIPAFGGGMGRNRPGGGMGTANALNADRPVRSIYLPIVRDQVPEALGVFDFAEPSLVVGDRDDTSVPSQALYLLNSSSVQKLAEAMAERVARQSNPGTDRARLAFQLAFSRPPNDTELAAAGRFFDQFNAAEAKNYSRREQLGRAGLIAFCQALLGSAEFRYLN